MWSASPRTAVRNGAEKNVVWVWRAPAENDPLDNKNTERALQRGTRLLYFSEYELHFVALLLSTVLYQRWLKMFHIAHIPPGK